MNGQWLFQVSVCSKGYEPVVVKNVTCPANIGTQQNSGKNDPFGKF